MKESARESDRLRLEISERDSRLKQVDADCVCALNIGIQVLQLQYRNYSTVSKLVLDIHVTYSYIVLVNRYVILTHLKLMASLFERRQRTMYYLNENQRIYEYTVLL